jgi:Mn-dependent DtxR family transcriptional regulator
MGGRPPETSDRQYLRFLADADAPFVFTSEAAEAFGVSQQGAYRRLSDLRDRGLVAAKTGQETAWWLTERGYAEANR